MATEHVKTEVIVMGETPMFAKMPRIQKEMLSCLQCGYCIEVCEAHAQTPWESVTPRGKIYYLTQLDKKNAIDKLLNRNVKVSDEFVDAMYKCTGCGNCEAVCHVGIELVAFWEKVRAWLVDIGAGPLPAHKKLADRINEGRNPYGEDPAERDAWWPEDVERSKVPDVIMFAGCTGSYRMQNIPKAGVKVLDRAGVKQNCLGQDEYCCTSPALRTGVVTLTKKAADNVVNKADAMGAKDMIMTCAGCFKTVGTDFGNHYSRTGQNVYHFTQYVDRLIGEKKLTLNHPIEAKVTYHDPCHLGRHSKVYDEPRNILKKIKGIKFVEMERNRENSRCCGAGGGYKSAFNDFAVNIAAERIRDAEAVGAEIIATACPFCVLNLNAGAKKIGSKVKVMDISEILLKVTAPIEASAAVAPAPAPAPAPVPEVVKEVPKPVVVEEPPPAPVPEVGEWDDLILDTPESRLRRILWKRGYRYRRNYGDDKITIAYPKPLAAIFVSDERDPETDLRLMDQKWSLIRFINSEMSDDSEKEAQIVIDLLNRRDAGAAAEAAKFAEPEPIPEPTEEAEEEMELDTPEYRLRRILWRRGYRYRRNYGDDNITIAYPNSDVAVFVSKDPDYGTDLRLIDKGWSLLRFYEADMTDSEKEAEIVIDLLNRRDAAAAAAAAKAVPKATPVPAEEEEDNDIFAEETPQDSADLKLRRRLWRRGYRYRKQYGDEKMNVAYLKAKVCAFVSKKDDNRTDDALRGEGWTVLRFREADVTDAVKEADAVIAAIEDSFDAHCAEYLTAAAEEHDDDVLADEMPSDCADLKIRRILWRRGYRYRKHYGKDDITIAFLKAKVAAFVGPEAKNRDTDDGLKKEGWNVLRFKDADVTDGKKEAERIITAIEKSLNSMMNEDLPAKGKVKVDEDVLKEEKADDPADLKLRRLLWWGGYRYRRKYGREKITVAFRRAKVGAFVSADAHRRKGDDQLVKRGWTVMRFRESNITDAKKEAAKVIAAVDRNLYLLSKGIIPEGANITCTDVLDRDVEENTPEYRLRMALWPTNRYRKNFGEENIDIAYPGSKVAVFVSDTTDRKPCDDRLEEDNWAVLRFKGVNITDGKKEAEKVIAAIEKNKKLVDAMESEKYDVDNMDDLAYLLEDTPELRVRRAVWKKKLRYRRNYSRYKIHMAFVKWQVAAFIDTDPKKRPVDDTLTSKGWIVLRFRESGITDGKKEAEQIFEAVKENKKLLKKPKKKPAKKKE